MIDHDFVGANLCNPKKDYLFLGSLRIANSIYMYYMDKTVSDFELGKVIATKTPEPEENELFLSSDIIFVGEDNLKEYALWLNSPWSYIEDDITICWNVYDSYSGNKPKGGKFRAVKEVTGYDGVQATLYGYGDTEYGALTDLLHKFEVLQAKYNPKGDAI